MSGAPDRLDLTTGVRRVVTAIDAAGKAVVAQDERVVGDPRGLLVWAADAPPTAGSGEAPDAQGWWPPPGGVRVSLSTRAPDKAPAARSPGQPWPDINDAQGFHASASTDIVVMVSGRIWLELDDGVELELNAGDVLVQNGTRHRWRNHGHDWPVMAVVIVGAAPAVGKTPGP